MDEKFKIPGPPSLTDMLDIALEQEEQEYHDKRGENKSRFPLSPSAFGSCTRELAINLAEFSGFKLYAREPFSAKTKKKFSRGHEIERSWRWQAKRHLKAISIGHDQTYISMAETQDGKYTIGGSLDDLYFCDEPMIVDYKSKGTFYSHFYTDKFREEFEEISRMEGVTCFGTNAYFIHDIADFYHNVFPQDNFLSRYFLQLNAYGASEWAQKVTSNKFPGVKGVKAVALWFENKNNHEMAELRWVPDKSLYEFAIKRMLDIYQWVVIDKKPAEEYEPSFNFGSLACKLCSRREICYPGAKHPYTGPRTKWPTPVDRLENSALISALYEDYKKGLTVEAEKAKVEAEIIRQLTMAKESKIKFNDGAIYEVKALKTPKPHVKLKRTK